MKRKLLVIILGLLVASGLPTSCARRLVSAPEADVPVKASFKVADGPSYRQDIQPIFDEYCVPCHDPNRAENGLRLDSYEHLMHGTRYGPVVIPEKSGISTLRFVVEGTASEKISMPHGGRRLSPNRIKNIMYWIDAGAKNN